MRHSVDKEKTSQKESFQTISGNEEMLSGIIEFFPFPIQVYTPDGTLVLTNEACLSVMYVQSKDQVIGKFNILKDPVIDSWGEGVREQIVRSFQGETVQFHNLKLPVHEVIDRFEADELCLETRLLNITCFPIFDDSAQLAYVVHVFVTSRLYDGRDEMVKAKEYIEKHWMEDFDLDKAARSVNLSRHHFSRLFKKHTAMTPFSYYQDIKISKLKERLCDENLSIGEAFSACGVDYNGNYARLFKDRVGMTPSQYRKTIKQK